MTTPTIEVAQMEAKVRALALLTSRLSTFVLDSPARPYEASNDPNATKRAVRNWEKAEALLALIALIAGGETDRFHLVENLVHCLEAEAIEAHSPLHLAVADAGARL